jgi:hypothetical protein
METWIQAARMKIDDYLFPSRVHKSGHISTRQYALLCIVGLARSCLIPPTTEFTRCAGPRYR